MPQNQKWYGVYRLVNGFPYMEPGLLSRDEGEAQFLTGRLEREHKGMSWYVCEVLITMPEQAHQQENELEVSHV